MNYLAHFYLADPNENLMFGNYIGDGVRGSQLNQFPEEIARGIRFHRFIDSYTDAHEEVLEAKRLFYPTQSKFSGVVVDVLFDHILAKRWNDFHHEELNDFAKRCYNTIAQRTEFLPIRSARFYQYMVGNNILSEYAESSGIERVFRGMDSRTKYQSNMAQAVADAQVFSDELSHRFDLFFPDLQEATSQWKSEH